MFSFCVVAFLPYMSVFVWVCSTADRRFYAKAEGVVILQYPQPGQQRFDADQNQNDTADALGGGAVFVAEHRAHLDADSGQQAGDDADKPGSRQDIHLHGGKADADSKDGQGCQRRRICAVHLDR